MSNPSFLPHTNITAVFWSGSPSNEPCVRVYAQDLNGGIRELAYNGTSWTFNKDPIAFAKPGSGIAAFKHYEDIHIYYVSNDDIIEEVTCDWRKPLTGNWDVPKYSLGKNKIKAHTHTRLTALPYNEKINCSVFYQNPAGYICHLRRIDSEGELRWEAAETFGTKPIDGTGLAAVYPDPYGTSQIRVYFQQSDTTLADFGVQDSGAFQPGALRTKEQVALTNTNLSTVSNELYFVGTTNWLSEGGYYSGDWHFENHPDHSQVRLGWGLAVILDGSGLHRAYAQNKNDQIVEYRFVKPGENLSQKVILGGKAQ